MALKPSLHLGVLVCGIIVPDQAQHKAGEMVLGHEVPHRRWQKQWLINLPGAECLAHAQRQNLTRSSLASKNHLLLGQAPRPPLLAASSRPGTPLVAVPDRSRDGNQSGKL